jgi:hypothetical protein
MMGSCIECAKTTTIKCNQCFQLVCLDCAYRDIEANYYHRDCVEPFQDEEVFSYA